VRYNSLILLASTGKRVPLILPTHSACEQRSRGWSERSEAKSAVAVAAVPHRRRSAQVVVVGRARAVVLSAMFSEVVDSERCAVVRDEWLPTR
jgi:hypothetical protein